MLRIMLEKMWQKKWMNLSLLLGCILLIATTVSFPLYQKAAYDRMLQDEFHNFMSEEGNWPMIIHMTANCQKDKKDTIGKMERYSSDIYDQMDISEYQTIYSYSIFRAVVSSEIKRDDAADMTLSLSAMTGLEDHAKLVTGEMYSESGKDENGAIEVIVPEATLTTRGLIVGESLTYDKMKTIDGDPITIKVVGVFTGSRTEDFYFQLDPEKMFDVCMMNPNLFREMFTGENAANYNIKVDIYDMFDYRQVTASQIGHINDVTSYLCDESAYKSVIKAPAYQSILEEYEFKRIRITTTLMILQIPVLVLLASFLLMISGQMYEMERNEISVIKSRGSSRAQILLLYIYQGLFLTVTGALIGVPLGTLFARILGATRNFLEFDLSQSLNVTFTPEALLYVIIAMIITLLSISIPAIKHSKVSIVNLKQQKAVGKKRLWEILFLDIVLIGVSLYGFYSFRKSLHSISDTVLSGKSLDPLLYISSSLFIVGTGLFFLRIQPYIVKLIYLCVRKLCGPAGYISFMENIKNGRKMQLIMLFLIMTISLGMFHATVARTILENAASNRDYLDGADIVIKEFWPMMTDQTGTPTGIYIEPDISKYMTMDFADSFTKVYYDDKAYIKQGKNDRTMTTILGIHTKEFGSITHMERDLNDQTYHEYLNELAAVQDGILLSRNFEKVQGVAIGDMFSYYTGAGKAMTGKVVDFVDYFPSYSPTVTTINADGNAETSQNYLIVTHYSYLKKNLGVQPYEVWISLKDDASPDAMYEFIDDHNIHVTKYVNKAEDMDKTMTDPLLQGTNGVLTMGFVVTILLCAVGYLIYWIMSIRERELIFGVLRACGFHKSEIVRMLVNEQIFCGLFSVLAGIGIGKLTSMMFVPMLQASYATSDQVLPMKLITRASDLYRLYGIIAAVMLTCVTVLIFLLFRMNVTKALKLGEE
ncbi:putative ABC transport system permease protein [Lachnospiraceae bacterium XBB2008]|nr:putative ABC transport system permease protein [Lachnospiraceae bacterium XBB2008]